MRQVSTLVADAFTYLIPDIDNILRWRAVLDLEKRQRFARLGVATNLVSIRNFLQCALDLVGHLLGHLLGSGSRPESLHDHRTESKRRVFVLSQLEIGREADHHQHDHQVAGQRRMLQRPA